MSETIFPNHKRYSDPQFQLVEDYGTIYKQKYLSRVSNRRLQAIGDNFVLIGLEGYWVSYSGSVISVIISSGTLIHDSTLITVSEEVTLTLDVATYADTTSGCHLGVFTDFQYIEDPDLDAQTELKLKIYHISSDGMTIQPAGFDADRCLILLAGVNFYKSGVNVIAADLDVADLDVEGVNLTKRGMTALNIQLFQSSQVDQAYLDYMASGSYFDNMFKKEFYFQDMSKR